MTSASLLALALEIYVVILASTSKGFRRLLTVPEFSLCMIVRLDSIFKINALILI